MQNIDRNIRLAREFTMHGLKSTTVKIMHMTDTHTHLEGAKSKNRLFNGCFGSFFLLTDDDDDDDDAMAIRVLPPPPP